jgi:hypothetical protein
LALRRGSMPITEVLVTPKQFEEAKKLIRAALQPHACEVNPPKTAADINKGHFHFVEDSSSLSVAWENIPDGETMIREAMYEEDAPTSYGVSS